MASLVVQGGAVVTGDGETMISNGALLLEGETVADVLTGPPRPDLIASADVVLDAAGGVIMPGFVNNHAHALTAGPRFASGAPSVGLEQALRNLDRHLLEGTTSLMNACGFCTADEVAQADRLHPINVRPATIHTPLNLRAAEIADGSGLAERHKRMTMAEMVERGAVGIGEVGAGHTLAGGGADYMYIPARVKAATGRDIQRDQAAILKYAVLGRYADPSQYDAARVQQALEQIGLADVLAPEAARELIEEVVLPAFGTALEGLPEAGEYGRRFGLPVMVHNSAPSARVVLELAQAGTDLVAGHSNHGTFLQDEACEQARSLRALGAKVDISTLGVFRGPQEEEQLFCRMIREGLVDTISTDYNAGDHDPMPLAIERCLKSGAATLPRLVALATRNVASAFPKLAPNRGELARGRVADIVVTDLPRISNVRHVVVGGRVVVSGGALARG
ncbi:MAG TPA: amidohydrolase [Chloroflexota bacterium]|nr:amidohydrolase [Chloroflexota bacterium]